MEWRIVRAGTWNESALPGRMVEDPRSIPYEGADEWGNYFEPNRPVLHIIELNTLEELLEFMSEHGSLILWNRQPAEEAMGLPYQITIYDDYVE